MLVLGDSHANAIVEASRLGSRPVFGGMLDTGRRLNVDFYDRSSDDVVFREPEVDKRYRGFLHEAGAKSLATVDMPVLCLFGVNLHYLSRSTIWSGFTVDASLGQFVSAGVLQATLRAMTSSALQFHRDLVSMGLEVFSTLPPRRLPASAPPSQHAIFAALEDLVVEELSLIGVTLIDHRSSTLDAQGRLRPQFAHPEKADDVHGSREFGQIVLDGLQTYRDQSLPRSSGATRLVQRSEPDTSKR